MSDLIQPLAIRLEQTRAREHLAWADERVMKIGNQLMTVLRDVHAKRSYRFDFDSFEDYCLKKWKISARRAHQIVSGENFRLLLAEAASGECEQFVPELKEGHLRELEKTTPENAIKIVEKLKKTGKRITAKIIATEINPEILPAEPPCLCPNCGQPIKKRKPQPTEI